MVKIILIRLEEVADKSINRSTLEDFHKAADFSCSERYPRTPPWSTNGASPLHIAAFNKQTASVTRLLAYDADVLARDVDGSTALHLAVSKDSIEVAEILLAHGADVNTRDQELRTPLMLCTNRTPTELVRLLLWHGAKKDARDMNGETALHSAGEKGNLNMFHLLIKAGHDPTIKNRPGQYSALASALINPQLATYIYAHGFDLEHMNPCNPGDFPLVHRADQSYLRRLLRYLPRKTCIKMINYETEYRPIALVQAATIEDIVALEGLMKAGADIELSSRFGVGSALIAACAAYRFNSVKFLVYHGAKYESTADGKPITALQAARHSPRLVQWLLVGRYTEQPRITNWVSQTGQRVKPWSGVRQLEIPLEGFYKRSHRQVWQSLFKYVCWIYRQKDSWRQMVPPSWKPEAHMAVLPGEEGHPLPACFAFRAGVDMEQSLKEGQTQCEKQSLGIESIELREDVTDIGSPESVDSHPSRRDSGSEETTSQLPDVAGMHQIVDVQAPVSSLALIGFEPYTSPILGGSSTHLLPARIIEGTQVMSG